MDDTDKVYPMKRAAICLLTLLALTLPRLAHAQYAIDDDNHPPALVPCFAHTAASVVCGHEVNNTL